MISKRLRQHTITLYTYTGETAGVATYSRTVIAGVFLEKDYQHVMARRGITTKDVAQVIIDLSAVTVATVAEFTANSFFCEGTVTDTIAVRHVSSELRGGSRALLLPSRNSNNHSLPLLPW